LLEEQNLVTWLPYDSIDVVFNNKNLWANRQNHHPACILYNLDEDPEQAEGEEKKGPTWEKLLNKEKMSDKDKQALTFMPISPNVSVAPALKNVVVDELRADLRTEMQQNLVLYRGKKGFDTFFDHGDDLMNRIEEYLNMQEMLTKMDPDSPGMVLVTDEKPGAEKQLQEHQLFIRKEMGCRRWNKRGSPYFGENAISRYSEYRKEQDLQWADLESRVKAFQKKLGTFPAKRGKKFRGFPVHFSTPDHSLIRNYLMQLSEYCEFIDKKDEVHYTIACVINSLLGGILSIWLYIGIQEVDHEQVE
jgi:hypothetical protein